MKSIADIKAIRDKMQAQIINRDNVPEEQEIRVVVGMGTCGLAAGSRLVFNEFVDLVVEKNLRHVKVSRTGCLGNCAQEPMVEVYVPGQEKVTYVKVTPEKAKDIIDNHIIGGNVCTDYLEGK